jgi:hypothetical protein
MKIKIFESYDKEKLEELVNKFGSAVEICDTQLTILPAPNQGFTHYVILVMYKETI